MAIHRFRVAFLLAAAATAGCGPGGPDYASTRLEGAVTIGGEPAPDGNIQFIPQEEGAGPAVGAAITDGRYVVERVPLGKVVARFNIVATSPGKPGSHGQDVVNLVPEKVRNGVEMVVTPDDAEKDFDLAAP